MLDIKSFSEFCVTVLAFENDRSKMSSVVSIIVSSVLIWAGREGFDVSVVDVGNEISVTTSKPEARGVTKSKREASSKLF